MMESSHLKRKDTTKGPPLRVLSLDGGGVRGYSMLIILQELMYRVYVEAEGRAPKREEIPKPCEHFDLIAGTGTGGLIAIMLGRLRLDLETCMDVYVRMTKKVFETDKTIAGIPYKQTLFKASKLEEAIRACVREHTIFEDEGNDGTASGGREMQDISSSPLNQEHPPVRRSISVRSNTSGAVTSPSSNPRNSILSQNFARWGNADASLYDGRERRTKTAVTAVYKGTNPKLGSSVLLRSYDSRKEPPPEFNCTIWQAGRATCATGLAFKPIQIGQSVFVDEGAGQYNPSPQILEEAAVNEWPGRDVGCFVSVGTGRRPSGTNNRQQEWWEGFVGGTVGNFAEARRRLITKIEACETTHIQMLNTELPRKGIPLENYCRLNVEVGVGEFGMNEWDRLSDMTIGTRRYLRKQETQDILSATATKMAKIELTRRRMERSLHSREPSFTNSESDAATLTTTPPTHPGAVELPAAIPSIQPHNHHLPRHLHHEQSHPHQRRQHSNPPYPDGSYISSQEKFTVLEEEPRSSGVAGDLPYRLSHEDVVTQPSMPTHQTLYGGNVPPPRPPKTPINDAQQLHSQRRSPPARVNGNIRLPYPENDGPPPIVSRLRKPEFTPR